MKVGILKNDGFEASSPDIGLIWDDAIDVAIEDVNNNNNILSDVHIVKVKNDTKGEGSIGMLSTFEQILEHHVAAIFGAMYSTTGTSILRRD